MLDTIKTLGHWGALFSKDGRWIFIAGSFHHMDICIVRDSSWGGQEAIVEVTAGTTVAELKQKLTSWQNEDELIRKMTNVEVVVEGKVLQNDETMAGAGISPEVDVNVIFTEHAVECSSKEEACCEVSDLLNVKFPDSKTEIGASAFQECDALINISIPDSVTVIGSHAFMECSSLAYVTLPDSVTSLGDFAFQECSSLAALTISKSLTDIRFCSFRWLWLYKDVGHHLGSHFLFISVVVVVVAEFLSHKQVLQLLDQCEYPWECHFDWRQSFSRLQCFENLDDSRVRDVDWNVCISRLQLLR